MSKPSSKTNKLEKNVKSKIKTENRIKMVADVVPVQLRWNNLTVSVGSTKIVENLSGTLPPKTTTGLIGPSGCGKTTLISCLTNTVDSELNASGEIYINDMMANASVIEDLISFASNDTEIYDDLSMHDQVFLAASIRHPDPETKTREIIDSLSMYEHKDKPFVILSGGQKIRFIVGVCVALMTPIIILDEPTTGLDSSLAYKLVCEIKRLSEFGRTVILSIHQPTEMILEALDNIIIMSAFGHTIFQGTIVEARQHFTKIGYPKVNNLITDADHYIRLVYAKKEFDGSYSKSIRERLTHLQKEWSNKKYPCVCKDKLHIKRSNSVLTLKSSLIRKIHYGPGIFSFKIGIINFLYNLMNIYILGFYINFSSTSLYTYFQRTIISPFNLVKSILFIPFTHLYWFSLLAFYFGFFEPKKPIFEDVSKKKNIELFKHMCEKFSKHACQSQKEKSIYKSIFKEQLKFVEKIKGNKNPGKMLFNGLSEEEFIKSLEKSKLKMNSFIKHEESSKQMCAYDQVKALKKGFLQHIDVKIFKSDLEREVILEMYALQILLFNEANYALLFTKDAALTDTYIEAIKILINTESLEIFKTEFFTSPFFLAIFSDLTTVLSELETQFSYIINSKVIKLDDVDKDELKYKFSIMFLDKETDSIENFFRELEQEYVKVNILKHLNVFDKKKVNIKLTLDSLIGFGFSKNMDQMQIDSRNYYFTIRDFLKKLKVLPAETKGPLSLDAEIAFHQISHLRTDYYFKDLFNDAAGVFVVFYFSLRFALLFFSLSKFMKFSSIYRKEYHQKYFSIIGLLLQAFYFGLPFFIPIITFDLIFLSSLFITNSKFFLWITIYLLLFVIFFLFEFIYSTIFEDSNLIAEVVKVILRLILAMMLLLDTDVFDKLINIEAFNGKVNLLGSLLSMVPNWMVSFLKIGNFLNISLIFESEVELSIMLTCFVKTLTILLILCFLAYFLIYRMMNSIYSSFNYDQFDARPRSRKESKLI